MGAFRLHVRYLAGLTSMMQEGPTYPGARTKLRRYVRPSSSLESVVRIPDVLFTSIN